MAETLLDFSKELDVVLLDQLVMAFFTGSGTDQQNAQQILTQFQDHEEAWTRADAILENSTVPETKFIALQIMDTFIQTRWNTIQSDGRDAIRNFIVDAIIKVSSDEVALKKERIFINKLNMVLVQILKQEWPRKWPSFIPEIVSSSKSNLTICENNMAILKLLSEEIFDYSAEQMTRLKTSNLRQSICNEFSEIFELCKEILEKATKPSLIKATLDTLLRFLSWIPIGYVFETDLLDLLEKFFESQNYRNSALKCLTEIASLSVDTHSHSQKILDLFTRVMSAVYTIITLNTDIATVYQDSDDNDQEFVHDLALFLTSFLTCHLTILEQAPDDETREALLSSHFCLIKISRVQDREIFKICLEYWAKLVQKLFEQGFVPRGHEALSWNQAAVRQRYMIYKQLLSSLRVIMIERMVKPEEVLIVENDQGEIVREFVKQSDTIVLYKSTKEVLVYLTNLDVTDTEAIMTVKLKRQIDGTEWSWQNLNHLCWAIGSISGAMTEDIEKRFLVDVIRDLLSLCEMQSGKDNKAVVASNIMYIVGQYPRFLKAHWKFLKTVVYKLFEFMHESHEGVQDMACDTFIKISQDCKRHFVVARYDEDRPFLIDIIENIPSTTSDLSIQQVHTFYEAVGYMISAETDKDRQEQLIRMLMQMPNEAWGPTMDSCKRAAYVLTDANHVKVLSNVLQKNVFACTSIGPGFTSQLSRLYPDLLILYRAIGAIVSQSVIDQGPIAVKTPRVRALRTIKRDILKLIGTFIERAVDLAFVDEDMVSPFLDAVLSDYKDSVNMARDAEVLNVLATMIKKLGPLMTPRISSLFKATFEPTLSMITNDFAEFPETRTGFYNLLRAINAKCFPALLELSPDQFKLFIDSIVWGFKHTMRDIADTSLCTCEELLLNIQQTDDAVITGAFYQSYYLGFLQEILFVVTDRDHKSGFKGQTEVLAQLFNLVTGNEIKVPLFDPSQVADVNISNARFLEQYVSALLQNAFPHLQSNQIKVFVMALLEYNTALPKFKLEVRDFLIQLKEFAGENAEFYLEEKEAQMEEKRRLEREKALLVPGMVKPSEMAAMEEDEAL